ncbi:MAG: hypothetical protein RIR74_1274 [Pseudomonadota bacterium]
MDDLAGGIVLGLVEVCAVLLLGGRAGQFPVTEDAGDTLVRLPLFSGLTEAEQEWIIDRVCAF